MNKIYHCQYGHVKIGESDTREVWRKSGGKGLFKEFLVVYGIGRGR